MPNELSFNTAKAWEDIYGHRVGLANMDKDPIHVGAVEAIPGATNLTMAPDIHHARQRRALAHAFSRQALLEQEPILKGYVNLFVQRLREMAHRGEAANMVSWFNFCTFDIIGDLSFGEPFGCLQEGKVAFDTTATFTFLIDVRRRRFRVCQLGCLGVRVDQGRSPRASYPSLCFTRKSRSAVHDVVHSLRHSRASFETFAKFYGEDQSSHGDQDGPSRLYLVHPQAARKEERSQR